MKKIIIILLIFMLYGCADYKEINDLGIISTIGIEYENNLFHLTTEVINIENKNEPYIYETYGSSIDEALAELSKVLNKKIFTSHLKALIIDKKIIEDNIDFKDFFLRKNDNKTNFNVYVTSSIKELVNTHNSSESNGIYLDTILEYNKNTFSSTTSLEFINMVKINLEYGKNNVYPLVSVKDNKMFLDKVITFNYENIPLILDEEQTIIYNIIKNNINKSILNIPCENNNIFSIEIDKSNTSYKYKKDIMNINNEMEVSLNNYNCTYDLKDSKTIKILNELVNVFIKEKMNNLIKLSKDNNNDFFGLGSYIYKHNYKSITSGSWDTIYPNLNTSVNVKTFITNTGDERTHSKDNNTKN